MHGMHAHEPDRSEPINKFYTYTPITSNQLSTHETDMKQNKDQYLHT